jgi:hypothetical protein
MKGYPNKVYLSTSWHLADMALTDYIVKIFIENNITVVGDLPEDQKKGQTEGVWTSRILQIVSDCSALVIIFPKRGDKQTTSPYMFPELLAADASGIPIIIFNHQGVLINKTKTNLGSNLHFGGKKSNNVLTYEELFVEYSGNEEIDSLLNVFSTLKLVNTKVVEGPYSLPDEKVDYKQIISNFISYKMKRVKGAFVFNVLPFSLKDKEHIEISKAVFEETGLPCRISLDSIGQSQKMRKQWRNTILESEFVIAEFSQLRDTCLYEAGVVMGMGKKIFLVAKKEPNLPYGLDDAPLKIYKSMKELRKIVKNDICAKYKRKVYNCEPTLIEGKKKLGGVPNWYFDKINGFSPILKLTLSSWVFSISIALIIWSLFVLSGSKDTPATLFGLTLSLIFGIGSHLRAIRSYVETKYIEKIKKLVGVSIFMLLVSILAVIYAYSNLPIETAYPT